MRVIKKSERIEMPWKNGGGITFEIDRHPAGSGDTYEWRLSQTPVALAGPFSLFPGYDRWFAVWQGDGLKLNGETISLLQPYQFHGENSILASPVGQDVTDIGLIYKRGAVSAEMRVARGALTLEAGTHYIIAKSAWTHESHEIETGDTLKIEGPAKLKLPTIALLISIKSS